MSKKRRKIAVADCETDPFKVGRVPKPFVWGFYDGEVYIKFDKTEDFVDYIRDKKIILYAHNGGKFDWHFVLDHMNLGQTVKVICGRLASFKIGECELRDSYNLLPVPLSAYQKTEISYEIFEEEKRKIPENKKLIEDYLKDDCIFLYELVETFINDYGLNLTLAGTAMNFWRKNFLGESIEKSSKFFFEEFQPYYYGGRVECFEKGIIEGDIEVHDINSAYPFAMKHPHAWGLSYTVSKKLPENFEDCFIDLRCVSKGAFPFRDKSGLSFPDDGVSRVYSITGWELKAAVDTNSLEDMEIIKVKRFKKSIDFGGYVDHFFAKKDEYKGVDPARYLISKTMLNSLYGKFATNCLKYKDYFVIDSSELLEYLKTGDFELTTRLGDDSSMVERPIDESDYRFYNLATAASITGFVRAYMLRHIKAVKRPLYCDTDSVAHVGGGGSFVCSRKIGDWEKEGSFTEVAIAGKKMYAFYNEKSKKCKIASKGVKFSRKEIKSVARGEKVVYFNEAPTFSLKGGARFISREIKMT